MSSKKSKQPAVRKPARKIIHQRVVRLFDAATQDSGVIRFGSGARPASIRK
jgi:hypothetical protein